MPELQDESLDRKRQGTDVFSKLGLGFRGLGFRVFRIWGLGV